MLGGMLVGVWLWVLRTFECVPEAWLDDDGPDFSFCALFMACSADSAMIASVRDFGVLNGEYCCCLKNFEVKLKLFRKVWRNLRDA